MSFSKTPEHTRMNASRSRWRLSMFAWILKTNPVNVSEVGSSVKVSPSEWTWRDDGPWLYAEQAVANAPDRPFRQRVYKLERAGDGTYRVRVFLLDEPQEHAGAWKSGSPLSEMSPADLEELDRRFAPPRIKEQLAMA